MGNPSRRNRLKHLRQVVWHVPPTLAVFLALVGIQLFGSAVIAFAFIIDDACESISPREYITLVALILLRALVVCVAIFPMGLSLDRLTRSRSIWLRLLPPIPLLVASGLLFYASWIAPQGPLSRWVPSHYLMLFLIALAALFAPYWYILQAQRLSVWLLKKARSIIVQAVSPSRACP